MSDGTSSYSPLFGGCLLVLLLWLIQWGLNFLTRFRGQWYSLSFIPSYIIIATITSIYPSHNSDDGLYTLCFRENTILFAIIALCLYACLGYLYRTRDILSHNKKNLVSSLTSNVVILAFLNIITPSIGNTNIVFHHEMAVANAIKKQNFDLALSIGKKSLENSHTLTTLRSFALSHTDSLGQKLFTYPQIGSANGLFFDESENKQSILTNSDIYFYLSAPARKEDQTTTHYLASICDIDTVNRKAVDYYLCSLLLNRQLDTFVQSLPLFYSDTISAELPRHYQEALLIYADKKDENQEEITKQCSPYIKSRYKAFLTLQQEYNNRPIHQRNYTRRKFGDTFWWYYLYAE